MRARGAALLAVIVAVFSLAVVAKGFVVMAHSRAYHTRAYQQQAQALYLAEAGIARAQEELFCNPDFSGELDDGLPGVEGRYELDLVNNVRGSLPKTGPRGPFTVPSSSAYLVVTGRCGEAERRLEAILYHRPGAVPPYGISSTGRIQLRGPVTVDGITGLATLQSVEAGVHSNLAAPDAIKALTWEPAAPGDTAEVTGAVSVSSTSAQAIDFAPAARVAKGFQRGVPEQAQPPLDLARRLRAASRLPPPNLSALGTSRLEGEFCHPGDLTVNGDLELSEGSLYVTGSLRVNGSIRGTGAVFVGGETEFKGDSQVVTSEVDGVALSSQGDVRLTGFDGEQFLEAVVAQDEQAAESYREYRRRSADMKSRIAAARANARANVWYAVPTSVCPLGRCPRNKSNQEVQTAERAELPKLLRSQLQQDASGDLARLAERVASTPPSETRDFLTARLEGLADLYSPPEEFVRADLAALFEGRPLESLASLNQAVALYAQSPDALATMVPPGRTVDEVIDRVLNCLLQSNFDKPGQASFQGTIYTNGVLSVDNEISVVGAVWAVGPPPTDAPEPQPGDVYLGRGVRLTLNQQYVQQQGGGVANQSRPKVTMQLEP